MYPNHSVLLDNNTGEILIVESDGEVFTHKYDELYKIHPEIVTCIFHTSGFNTDPGGCGFYPVEDDCI